MNTAIAALMAMVNEFYANGLTQRRPAAAAADAAQPLRPPHGGGDVGAHRATPPRPARCAMQMPWPTWDESKTVDCHVEMAVQVNGKLKGTVTVAMDSDEETVKAAALALDKVQKATGDMTVVKTILVKNKLINLIVKPAK